MDLKLTKPIAFIDLETTGINVSIDRIVEISILRIEPNGKKETRTHRVNPGVPIPQKASEIHGIYDKDIKDAPGFADLAKSLVQFLDGCDLAGYNSNKFDIPLLAEEFLRADVEFDMKKRRFVDVQNIFHKMEQRTLSAAFLFYCNKNLEGAHGAEADVHATFDVLRAQLDKYKELENNVDFLDEFSSHLKSADLLGRITFNEQGNEIFNFGKHKGKIVEEVFEKEPSYYNWMMNGEFPLYTKKIITAIKLRALSKR